MKIIDLLNKIANGEEVPNKIKYNNEIFEYYERLGNTFNYKQIVNGKYIDDYFNDKYFIDNILNDEVEEIEESKEIEELECNVEAWFTPSQADIEIIKKLNELIKEVNKLNENKNNIRG